VSRAVSPVNQVVSNPLYSYYSEIQQTMAALESSDGPGAEGLAPEFRFPPPDARLEKFFATGEMGVARLPDYQGRTLRLLDLTRNPGARTTKTFASLAIVARAVRYIQETGERVMIVTPSSANKATALRDAVLRAIETGLAGERQLQILTVVPAVSAPKLWSSRLSADPDLRVRNPMVVHEAAQPETVKQLAAAFVRGNAAEFERKHGIRLWYTLSLANYMAADMVRAFVERDFLPSKGPGRVHVHAVSSAFGLLGHHLGHQAARGNGAALPVPRYFLVQHLGAPDMVLSVLFGSPEPRNMPQYQLSPADGLYRQDRDPHFPAATFDPAEILDTTFYTRRPVTSEQIDPIIKEHGGGGIIVSLHECLQRYAEIRRALSQAQLRLPADPRRLREWSLVMAVTGAFNAIDRGLVAGGDDILIHGSGSYTQDDFEPLAASHRYQAADLPELTRLGEKAARA
jgi:Family of unknown function (DUF6002)